MWMIVGLGNPGKKYGRNRHNIGFMVLDAVVEREGLRAWRDNFGGKVCSCAIDGHNLIIFKPMEFMNQSGFAVARVAHFHQVEPSHIIVIHDDIDLPLGRIRLKAGGGHGGHNGVRSIASQLGSPDFLRVRLGVGKPTREDGVTPGEGEISRYVLSDFTASEQPTVDELIQTGCDAVGAILNQGIRAAMNKFNGPGKSPADEKQKES